MADNPRPVVRIIHHLSRSGGTLICRCLGSMRNVLLLSEVHPMGFNLFSPTYHPISQAHRWFDLFSNKDIALIQKKPSMDFTEIIELISSRCKQKHYVLLLRDWTHLDFTAVPFLATPCYRLTTAEVLCKRFDVIQTTTVRHPIDQWLSLSKSPSMKDQLSIDNFLHGYRLFSERCVQIGFVRYEDFVRTPEVKARELCERLRIKYDHQFLNKWSRYDKITGATSMISMNRLEIMMLPRKPINPSLIEQFEQNTDYQASLKLLGYSHPV